MATPKRQAILFCGIPATGKSTFYKEQFFQTHIRISLDQLKTRNRETQFLHTCIVARQHFVVDNTNPTTEDRSRYIALAKEAGFEVIGYYFKSSLPEALARNRQRAGKENIPEVGIKGIFGKLQIPSLQEGFDVLYYVEIVAGSFKISTFQNEI